MLLPAPAFLLLREPYGQDQPRSSWQRRSLVPRGPDPAAPSRAQSGGPGVRDCHFFCRFSDISPSPAAENVLLCGDLGHGRGDTCVLVCGLVQGALVCTSRVCPVFEGLQAGSGHGDLESVLRCSAQTHYTDGTVGPFSCQGLLPRLLPPPGPDGGETVELWEEGTCHFFQCGGMS